MKHALLTSPINRTAGILEFFTSFPIYQKRRKKQATQLKSCDYQVGDKLQRYSRAGVISRFFLTKYLKYDKLNAVYSIKALMIFKISYLKKEKLICRGE